MSDFIKLSRYKGTQIVARREYPENIPCGGSPRRKNGLKPKMVVMRKTCDKVYGQNGSILKKKVPPRQVAGYFTCGRSLRCPRDTFPLIIFKLGVRFIFSDFHLGGSTETRASQRTYIITSAVCRSVGTSDLQEKELTKTGHLCLNGKEPLCHGRKCWPLVNF